MPARQGIKGTHESFKIVSSPNKLLHKTDSFPEYTPTLNFKAMWLQKTRTCTGLSQNFRAVIKINTIHTLMLAVLDKANSITKCTRLKAGCGGAYGRSREGAAIQQDLHDVLTEVM